MTAYTLRNQRASGDFEYSFFVFFFCVVAFLGGEFSKWDVIRRRLLLYCVRVAHAKRDL